MAKDTIIRLNVVMTLLGINGANLSRASGVDRTLITRWQSGDRRITTRSKQIHPLAEALIRLDDKHVLQQTLAPYKLEHPNNVDALREYLLGEDLIALTPQAKAPTRQIKGEYVKETRVFLGQKGIRRAALAMLEYVRTLPPGRELIIICELGYEWIIGDMPFMLECIDKMQKAIDRGTILQIITRKSKQVVTYTGFAAEWFAAQMHGTIYSYRYSEAANPGSRFIASIPGFWSAHAVDDPEVEDSLYLEMHTDPKDIRSDEAICRTYLAKCYTGMQFGFFNQPTGDEAHPHLWKPGQLPSWENASMLEPHAPGGSFHAVTALPGFGIMKRSEFLNAIGKDSPPALPDYLFSKDGVLAPGPHKFIFCREMLCESLQKLRFLHEPLSLIMHRRIFVTQRSLRAMLTRIVHAMDTREDVEVALLPRIAFEKLQLELVSWQHSASIAWQRGGGQSFFTCDAIDSAALYGYAEVLWKHLMSGWKRRTVVRAQLRKWINGKELDKTEPDSIIVRNWRPLQKSAEKITAYQPPQK